MSEREARIADFRQAQPLSELARKAGKARSRSNQWQQEELDWVKAQARQLHASLQDLFE